MTLHDLIEELIAEFKLTPEQQFRWTAKIKRHVHCEKAGLCHRLSLYSQGMPVYDKTDPKNLVLTGRLPPKDPVIYEILEGKYKTHEEWSNLPDEDIVTWDIGTHKYKQEGK